MLWRYIDIARQTRTHPISHRVPMCWVHKPMNYAHSKGGKMSTKSPQIDLNNRTVNKHNQTGPQN